MWKIRILREHTVGYFKASCIRQAVLSLERIQATFFLNHTERFNRINMLFTVTSRVSSYQFKSDRIIQAFFIDYKSDGIFFSTFNITIGNFFRNFSKNHFNGIPFFNNFFFPCSQFFRLGIVICR